MPGHRGLDGERLHDLAASVDLDVSPAVDTAQRRLETRLDADLAHHLVVLVTARTEPLEVGVVERTDVTDHVAECHRINVRAHGVLHDRCTGQRRQALVDGEDLCLRQLGADAHRSKLVGYRQ